MAETNGSTARALAPTTVDIIRRLIDAYEHGEESPDFIEDIARIVDDARPVLAGLEG